MRSRTISVLLLLLLGAGKVFAVNSDPALQGAIVTQMEMLRQIYAKREKTQQAILASEAAVTLAFDRMHAVENKALGYMKNVQGAVQNLYQIKRATELVAKEIPGQISWLKSSVGAGHFKGTAVAALVSDRIWNATAEMTSLIPFMAELVQSGSYSVTGDFDEKGNPVTKHVKVNLLNSAERYYVCYTIVDKLEKINDELYLLGWEIRMSDFNTLWYGIDPEGWCEIMGGKVIGDMIVSEWKKVTRG